MHRHPQYTNTHIKKIKTKTIYRSTPLTNNNAIPRRKKRSKQHHRRLARKTKRRKSRMERTTKSTTPQIRTRKNNNKQTQRRTTMTNYGSKPGTEPRSCIVCGAPTDTPHYPNKWNLRRLPNGKVEKGHNGN